MAFILIRCFLFVCLQNKNIPQGWSLEGCLYQKVRRMLILK